MPKPFFRATDFLGAHVYFLRAADAQMWRDTFGGTIHETTRGRVWRVTAHRSN